MSDTSSASTTGPGQIFATCPYCGQFKHAGKCPQVSAFEYHPNGALKRVEFHGPLPAYITSEPFPKPDPTKGWVIY